MEDLITIVIPSYNREALIGKTLDSVIAQTHKNWECFVVDDLSTDATCNVVKTYEKKDARIHLVAMPQKGNANVSRNKGIALANGNYIAFLDSDDLWLPNHLESRLKCLKNADAQGVYGGHIQSTNNTSETKLSREQLPNESNFYFVTFSLVPKQTSGLLFKKEAIESIKWDNTLKRHQDFDLMYRFLNAYSLVLDTEITVVLNVDPSRNSIINSSGKAHNLYLDGCLQFYNKYKQDFYANPFEAAMYLYSFVKLLVKKKNWVYAKYFLFKLVKVILNPKRFFIITRVLLLKPFKG